MLCNTWLRIWKNLEIKRNLDLNWIKFFIVVCSQISDVNFFSFFGISCKTAKCLPLIKFISQVFFLYLLKIPKNCFQWVYKENSDIKLVSCYKLSGCVYLFYQLFHCLTTIFVLLLGFQSGSPKYLSLLSFLNWQFGHWEPHDKVKVTSAQKENFLIKYSTLTHWSTLSKLLVCLVILVFPSKHFSKLIQLAQFQ